ncbi:MAG: DUF1048 domain-containing protein [Nocardioidaceae bacterium]
MATGWTEQKRRYRQYKARTKRLPENYHSAIDALERYMEFFGPGKGDSLLSMLEDLVDLFEQSARTEPRSARSSGRTRWNSPRRFFGTTRRVSG